MKAWHTGAALLAVTLISGCAGHVFDRGLQANGSVRLIVNAAAVAVETGCGPADEPELDQSNWPIESRRSTPIYPPILSGKAISEEVAQEAEYTAIVPKDAAGLDMRYRALVGDDLVTYFSDSAISADETIVDLMRAGGMMVLERPTTGVDLAERAKAALGAGSTSVAVGSTTATMNLGDEWAKGGRPYYLFWTDRGSDWTLVAGIDDAAAAIDVARSIACR